MKPEKQFFKSKVMPCCFVLLTFSFQSFGQVTAVKGDSKFFERDDNRLALLEKLEAGKEIGNSEIRETFRKHNASGESVPYLAGEFSGIYKESASGIIEDQVPPYMDIKDELDALREELHSVIQELKSEIKKMSSEIKAEAEKESQFSLFSS